MQSNGIKRKNSSPAESRMTPFASAAIASVNKIADRSVILLGWTAGGVASEKYRISIERLENVKSCKHLFVK